MLHLKNSAMLKKAMRVMIILFFLLINVQAQKSKNVVISLNENTIGNLNSAIRSENPGLRKSGIYLAGKYSIKESAEALLDQLKVEEDPSLRILIVRVLYIIGNDEYMDDIYSIASQDNDLKVRKIASAIFQMMQVNKSLNIADTKN